MTAAERRRERLERTPETSFEVVSGGGLDARARAGVSPQFVARLRLALVVAVALIGLGMARVAISAATVSMLRTNVDLNNQIEAAQSLNEQLRVQRSSLSSNARISRIATQNYGMVLSTSAVAVDVTPAEEPDDASATDTTSADVDDASTADADAASADVPADGDAAQTAEAAA